VPHKATTPAPLFVAPHTFSCGHHSKTQAQHTRSKPPEPTTAHTVPNTRRACSCTTPHPLLYHACMHLACIQHPSMHGGAPPPATARVNRDIKPHHSPRLRGCSYPSVTAGLAHAHSACHAIRVTAAAPGHRVTVLVNGHIRTSVPAAAHRRHRPPPRARLFPPCHSRCVTGVTACDGSQRVTERPAAAGRRRWPAPCPPAAAAAPSQLSQPRQRHHRRPAAWWRPTAPQTL